MSARRRPAHRLPDPDHPGRRRLARPAIALVALAAGAVVVAQPAMAAPSPIALTSSSCPAVIAQGAGGGCVVELQRLLDQHGANLAQDGAFGPATYRAVRVFQSGSGIAVDGLVGPQTKAALYAGSGSGSGSSGSGGGSARPAAVDLRSPACPAVMVSGEVDGCVTTLQALLNGKGRHVAVDGSFGPLTAAAVRGFQSDAHLAVDGKVGPNTKAALYANVANPGSGAPTPIRLTSPACPVDIRQGQTGGCVTELQSLLNAAGEHLSVDGVFGPGTAAAVRDYQLGMGLAADGVVGPATKAALYSGQAPVPTPRPSGNVWARIVADGLAVAHAGNVPYVWGGGHSGRPGPSIGTCVGYTGSIHPCPADHTVGVDCSGFVRWMYAKEGIDLGPGGTGSQIGQFRRVSKAQAIPGDVVFYFTGSGSTHHVGIYIGDVNGVPMMVDALMTGTQVRVDRVTAASGFGGYYHHS